MLDLAVTKTGTWENRNLVRTFQRLGSLKADVSINGKESELAYDFKR